MDFCACVRNIILAYRISEVRARDRRCAALHLRVATRVSARTRSPVKAVNCATASREEEEEEEESAPRRIHRSLPARIADRKSSGIEPTLSANQFVIKRAPSENGESACLECNAYVVTLEGSFQLNSKRAPRRTESFIQVRVSRARACQIRGKR